MLKIALDIDGVVADSRAESQFRVISEFGNQTWNKLEKQANWDSSKHLPKGWLQRQFDDPTFWLNAFACEDAWYMMNKWFGMGHDIYLVTERHTDETIEVTERWLEEWDMMYSWLYHSQPYLNKHLCLRELDVDLFVDDNAGEVRMASTYIPSCLRTQVYNRGKVIGNGIVIDDLFHLDRMLEQWPSSRLNVTNAENLSILKTLSESTAGMTSLKSGTESQAAQIVI